MSAKAMLATIGGVLLLAGLVLGFVPVKADGVSCGSALRGNSDARVADLVDPFSHEIGSAADDCDAKRSSYQPIVWTLLAVGGVLFLVELFVPGKSPAATAA